MPMITITDDYTISLLLDTDKGYFRRTNFKKTTGEDSSKNIEFIVNDYPRTLHYSSIESQQKAWDRLCEITGAKDIFEIEDKKPL